MSFSKHYFWKPFTGMDDKGRFDNFHHTSNYQEGNYHIGDMTPNMIGLIFLNSFFFFW